MCVCLDFQNSLKGVVYLGQLSIPKTHQVISDSFALVNSSVSEGMSTAILEVLKSLLMSSDEGITKHSVKSPSLKSPDSVGIQVSQIIKQ